MLRREMWRSHAPESTVLVAQPLRGGNGNGVTFNRMHRVAVQNVPMTAMTGWDFFRRPVSLRGSDSRRVGTQPQGSMLTLFHHPFCPHSRFIRLALAEHGLEHRTIEERVWERREEFLMLNPAATTPVLVAEGYPPVPGAATIAEFLDETQRRRAAASAG